MNSLKRIISLSIMLSNVLMIKADVFADKIINDIVKETMLQSEENQTIRIAWWLPEEFWIESFKLNKAVSKEQIDQFISLLHPFTLIVAIDGKIGVMGGITYSNQNDIRNNLILKSS